MSDERDDFVTEQGRGEPLVILIHGWSCQRTDWAQTLAAMPQDLHCLALDLPGHGEARDRLWDDWTIEGLAKAVTEVADQKGARRLILVGHSMGGCVALEAARRWSGPVGVVLVDSFGLPYGDMDAETIAVIEEPFKADFRGAMAGLVDNTTVAELNPEIREWIKARMAAGDPERLLPIWHNLLRWSPDAAFAAIKGPIVALNGEHISEAAQKRCAPYVQETVLPGTHHFPQFEQPRAFALALQQSLESIASQLNVE